MTSRQQQLDGVDDARRNEVASAIEAIVLVATDPVPEQLLAQIVEAPITDVRDICHELADEYRAEGRGFELANVAGGWRYQTRATQAHYVERFVIEGQSAKLSGAALETLAIIAYKQPISRAQVSAIRGVNVDAVLKTLTSRGYVAEHSRDTGPGQAVLFGTTGVFLERLGLSGLDQMPELIDFVPPAHIVEALESTLLISGETGISDQEILDLGQEPIAPVIDINSAEARQDAASPAEAD
jgi:segregation and condensation protein B